MQGVRIPWLEGWRFSKRRVCRRPWLARRSSSGSAGRAYRVFNPDAGRLHAAKTWRAGGMNAQENILVTGSRGLIGGGVVEALGKMGMRSILAPSRQELDLKDARAVEGYFALHKPDYVFLLAGVAGGIARNSLHGAEMMHDNLA